MGYIGRKWSELVYTLTSNDRYAGYHSSKNIKSLSSNNDTLNDDSLNGINESNIIDNNNSNNNNNNNNNQNLSDLNYSVDEREQAQLVSDSWEIIETILNSFNFDEDFDSIDDLQDIPDSEDLINSLSNPCTLKDLKVAQNHLGIKFPYPVLQYFLIHDGQETLPSSTKKLGLMYGLELLSLAEVVTMTNYWRKVANKEVNSNHRRQQSLNKIKIANEKAAAEDKQRKNSITNNKKVVVNIENDNNNKNVNDDIENEGDDLAETVLDKDPNFKVINKLNKISENDLKNYPDLVRNISTHSKQSYLKKLPNQKSFPEGKIKLQYANPNWIPLVTDNTGNYIAIDLDPDTKGIFGQVIIFGRDFDTKYVISNNWGEFMNIFATDFKNKNKCKLDYDEDLGFNLVYVDNYGTVIDQGYLYVLSQRLKGKSI